MTGPSRPAAPRGTRGTPARLAARLRLALNEVNRRTRPQEAASGLSPGRLSALAIVAADGPLRIGELAARMAVSTPTVSHIVDALDEQGLIARRHDPHDRRVCLVGIGPAGRKLLADLCTQATDFLTDRIGRLPPEQQETLADALPVLEALGRP
ncbi:MarR family winged helix-turn-helix transcriptional regulator [Actinomadura scrupuli]|uniref:MarR family winged helix-turn-helix transcriptional regulator n=1 Tax=Actinomadura scrupuli TaxID=559629 RepID=UPI003D9559DC